MKIATLPRKRRKDLITTLILLIGLPILVYASYQIYHLIVGAQEDALPRNVVVSNVSHSSVTVSWVTDARATSSVIPVVNDQEQSPVLDSRGHERRNTHYIVLEYLEPSTEYEFIIVSNSDKHAQIDGETLKFKTAPVPSTTPSINPIYGSVSGARADDVVVFLMLKDKSAYPVSAIMPRGGNWLIDGSQLRNINDMSLETVIDSTNLVLTAVTGVAEGSVIEGTFSELFDSNGRLKEIYSLNVAPDNTLFSYFPASSIVAGFVGDVPLGGTQPLEPVDDPIDIPFPDDFEEEDWEEEEPEERRFGLVHDIEWTDMVTGQGGVTANTGESSIQIVNRTDTGFSVVWVSEQKEEGYLAYGTSPDNLNLQANDERDGLASRNSYYVHMVSLTRLQPDMEYFFEVRSGNNIYDNGGAKYSVRTFSTLSLPPPLDSINGQIDGIPEHREAVVLAQIEDADNLGSAGTSSQVASVVDENGRWILSIADSRTEDGLSYFEYTSEDILNIDIVTTFPTATHEESMQGISNRDIDITLEEQEGISTREKVPPLDSYGVLGIATRNTTVLEQVFEAPNNQATVDSQALYSVLGVTETPKTGISNHMSLIVISGITVVVVFSLVYISKVTKRSKKGNMKNDI